MSNEFYIVYSKLSGRKSSTDTGDACNPLPEALLELLRVQHREETPQRIIGGYPVGQAYKPPQPAKLQLAEVLDLRPAVSTRNHWANSEEDDVGKRVKLVSQGPAVLKRGKGIKREMPG